MSSKNKLQEFFQKKQLTLPKYKTSNVGGQPHDPLWQSIVTLHDGSSYSGDIVSSKVEAELSAAEKALLYLNNESFSPKPILIEKIEEKRVVLIDVENCPKAVDELLEKTRIENLIIYAFVGKDHPLSAREYRGVKKILVPSNRKDAVDTCMIMYASFLLFTEVFEKYYIITGDHFGPTLAELMTSEHMPWKAKATFVCTNIDKFIALW